MLVPKHSRWFGRHVRYFNAIRVADACVCEWLLQSKRISLRYR